MAYNFEKLDVWKLALEYADTIYDLAGRLPAEERYNLKSQIRRAGTGIALNIAEGSTSQSPLEQRRLLGLAVRSLIETVACQHLIRRRYDVESKALDDAYSESERLFAKLQAFRRALDSGGGAVREVEPEYEAWEEDGDE